MKTGKKKARPLEPSTDELVRKPAKKMANKRDRRISIYNPVDEEDENLEIENLFDYDPDLIDEDEESDY
ncbi:MAG: hypothetical protein HOO86_09125 [Bacteroidales bacterium]|nr:hypothetical protein [Bacteroidales bacterium]